MDRNSQNNCWQRYPTVGRVEIPEHYAFGETATTYTGVTVAKPGGCKVYTDNGSKGEEGVIHTEKLRATTRLQNDSGKLEPGAESGGVFARFLLEGCINSGLNGTYTVTGSVKCPTEGATIKCSHLETTSQNTLKLNGAIKAGVSVTTTPKAKNPAIEGDSYKAISPTTVET